MDIGAWAEKSGGPTWQSGARRCKPLNLVAGGCFDLCSAFRVVVPAVPATVFATG